MSANAKPPRLVPRRIYIPHGARSRQPNDPLKTTHIRTFIAFRHGLLLLAVLAVALPAQQRVAIPPPRGMVNDFANVMSAEQVARLDRLVTFVRDKSKGEITVVTLPDIGTRDVGDEALRIGREWKVGANTQIGDAARNAGTVILLVPRETSTDGRGHISITTGQGTEGFLTDGQAGDIRREATPLLAQRRYGDGLELIAQRVAERYAANFGFALDSLAVFPAPVLRRDAPRDGGGRTVSTAFVVFVVLLLLFTNVGRRNSGCLWFALSSAMNSGRRGGWSGGGGGWGGGGGGGGGFGGFGGGGGFSGGGSSGSF